MYLTHLCHIHNREAREENAIRTPKSVLPRLKKDISFLKAKLTLLHKMFGLDCLAKSLEEDEKMNISTKVITHTAPMKRSQICSGLADQ